MWAAEAAFSRSGSWREAEDEREALRWAALQRLPTVARARRGLLRSPAPGGAAAVEGDDVLCEVDVAGLSSGDRTALVDRLLADSSRRAAMATGGPLCPGPPPSHLRG